MKNENILVIPIKELSEVFDLTKEYWDAEVDSLNTFQLLYMPRVEAEMNFDFKQLIPYAIFEDKNGDILTYKRCGSEKRLKGIHSLGIGGHVNDSDQKLNITETLITGLIREVEEETNLHISKSDIEFKGFINEERSEVGHCHLGVVFKIHLKQEKPVFDKEIGNPQWINPDNINLDLFELWSILALSLIK